MDKQMFRYRICLDSTGDVIALTKAAAKCPHELYLVNGRHRLSAKSYLGVALARISWDEVWIEADYDCYFDFERFIARGGNTDRRERQND